MLPNRGVRNPKKMMRCGGMVIGRLQQRICSGSASWMRLINSSSFSCLTVIGRSNLWVKCSRRFRVFLMCSGDTFCASQSYLFRFCIVPSSSSLRSFSALLALISRFFASISAYRKSKSLFGLFLLSVGKLRLLRMSWICVRHIVSQRKISLPRCPCLRLSWLDLALPFPDRIFDCFFKPALLLQWAGHFACRRANAGHGYFLAPGRWPLHA